MAQLGSLLATLFAMTVLGTTVFAQEVDNGNEALKAVTNSNLDFTNSLYKILSREQGNLLFSPLSIHTILALTSQGARGVTEQEMSHGLLLPQEKQHVRDGFRHLMTSLQATNNVTLKIANKVFADNRFPIKEEFARTAQNDFLGQSQVVDFHHKPDEARVTINNWVESNTDQKIKNLLAEGTITARTAVVLVNAVYFKGNWETRFDPQKTTQQPFHVSVNETKQVPMMHLTVSNEMRYKDSSILDAHILEMPYSDNKVSLVIVLPKTRNGIANLESKLANIHFSNITARGMTRPKVNLALPKFKVEMALDMKGPLETMGMQTMFTDRADLSGMADGPLSISKVAHKAFMEVTEEGTVAAAATGVISMTRSERVLPEVTMVADHPFIFCLVKSVPNDHNKKTVLFMGRYSQP